VERLRAHFGKIAVCALLAFFTAWVVFADDRAAVSRKRASRTVLAGPSSGGARVRVRSRAELYNGPQMEIAKPAAIATLDEKLIKRPKKKQPGALPGLSSTFAFVAFRPPSSPARFPRA
jgi:hypothetical protein